MKSTDYFRNVVSVKHPGIEIEWILAVINAPIKQETQADGRTVYWGNVPQK